MELNTISGLAIAGVICSVVLSMGVPIALFIAGRVKLKARISSFFIGAGTYLLFAMLLEQLLHVLVIQFCGLNAQSRPWLYYVYAALAAAVFEETGRLIAMKFWMKKWLDFPNALMYGIGHGGVEAILLGGLSGISNLVFMLMINSGAMHTICIMWVWMCRKRLSMRLWSPSRMQTRWLTANSPTPEKGSARVCTGLRSGMVFGSTM